MADAKVPLLDENGRIDASALPEGVGAPTPLPDRLSESVMLAQWATKADALQVFTAANSRRWRRALARARTGAADAKLLCIGDSTTAGVGSGVIASNSGGPSSYPYQLAQMLNAAAVPAARGLGIQASNALVADPRWTLGTGWTYGTGLGFARRVSQGVAAAAGNLTFTETTLADRYDIYFVRSASQGTVTATATGGAPVTQAFTGASGIGKFTVSAAEAATTNVVTIQSVGTNNVAIVGIEPWHSTQRRVRVGNAGVGSSTTVGDWTGAASTFDSSSSIKAYAPDLTIISLGINDGFTPQTVAAYIAALNLLIAAAQVSGDVLLLPPFSVASGADANVKGAVPLYAAAVKGLGLPFVDVSARMISGDDFSALGLMSDSIHPNALGYSDIAQAIASKLLAV